MCVCVCVCVCEGVNEHARKFGEGHQKPILMLAKFSYKGKSLIQVPED